MAGAYELVLSRVKWHHATKVSADSVDSICGKSSVFLHHKVCRITLIINKESKLVYLVKVCILPQVLNLILGMF